MNVKKGVKGAVSVFIVLILVPCIVASSLFIDVGRVSLGHGVATSAADLALNSLMSNYDEVLADYYGFIASCQNIEDFYAESAEYFLTALRSQGLSDDDIDSLFAVYQKYIGDTDDISDLMELSCVSEDPLGIISDVGGASVGGSSAIIKDQMVEFMKFRGPINIVSNIIGRLKTNDASAVMEQSEESEELIESKKDFASDEEALLKAAFDTYTYIKKYETEGIDIDRIETLKSNMIKYRKLYKEMTEVIVSNLHDTKDLKSFSRPTYSLSYSSKKYTAKNVCSRSETVEGVTTYYVDGNTVKSVFESVEKAINEFDNAKANVVSSVGTTLTSATVGSGSSDANPIQWWSQVSSKISKPISTLKTKAQNMLTAYNKMKVMYEDCTYDNSLPDYGKNETVDLLFATKYDSTYSNLKSRVESRRSTYLKAGVTNNSDSYLKLVGTLESVSSKNSTSIVANNIRLSNNKTIGQTASEISAFLDKEGTALKNAIDALDVAIDGSFVSDGNWFIKSLDSVKDLVREYNSSFNTWSSKVKVMDPDNPLAETEKAELDAYNKNEIDNGQNDGQPRQIKIKEADVTELKTRLVNIRNQCKTVYNKINELKYGGKKLVDLDSYDKVYSAVKGHIGDVPLTNGKIKEKANTVFSTVFSPYSGDLNQEILILTNFKEDDYNPDLEKKKPKLYDWMCTKFKGEDGSGYDTQKNKVDSIKGSAEDSEKEAENKTKEDGISKKNITDLQSAADFPSGLDGENAFGIINGLGDIGSLIKHLVKGEFTSMRDSLYATEYVMSMFSYATFDEEGKYALAKKSNFDLKHGSHDAAFNKVEDQWKSTDLKFTDNKTLTNKLINSEQNIAFGAEAEYVLYGGKNKDNVKDAFGDIYTIRYALNTISGFQHFWSNSNDTGIAINTFANGVCAYSSGIIPAPVVKIASILLITAIETGVDLDRLKDGFPVEIYKTKDTQWATSFSLSGKESSKNDFEEGEGLFYSDYIYLFLCLGFNGKKGSEMYLRVGDLIQAQMRKTQGDAYSLKKSRVYFQLNAKVRVDPLMLELPMVSGYTEGIGATKSVTKDDWCTFDVKVTRGYS